MYETDTRLMLSKRVDQEGILLAHNLRHLRHSGQLLCHHLPGSLQGLLHLSRLPCR